MRVLSKVFVNIGLSLDGYMAPEGMTMGKPEYKNWGAKWGAMMAWIVNQQYFRENLKLGPGGETGPVKPGQRRLRFTHRYTFSHVRNGNPGRAPVGRPFTSSMTGQRVHWSWLGNPQAVVMFASRVGRM
jgi:hypothetical protein